MNKSMTKLSILSFLGLGLVTYAQKYDGKVGINNTTPHATLEITSKSANGSMTLEGIIIPNVSKNKALQMTLNTDPNPKIKESTLIYVDDLSDYKGTDEKVESIVVKGYYFWDGKKWASPGGGTFVRNIRRDNRAVITVDTDELGEPVKTPDYFVHLTGNPTQLNLPPANTSVGRTLCFYNPSWNLITINPQPIGQMQSLDAGMTSCYISDGTIWINSTGY
ncbi:hypothetical protein D1J36_003335 [Riemerella anatipestifer]|uniref:hypothetical protein n=1 Tax=Riemerella anatipestifer TaxID=34085 RepID=UPI0012AE74B3|nr:hypothetical protein [Riemerella anatipestifer]USL96153.1 hypothetical protein D1J36_003335 [Riemerella anatipestifer]